MKAQAYATERSAGSDHFWNMPPAGGLFRANAEIQGATEKISGLLDFLPGEGSATE